MSKPSTPSTNNSARLDILIEQQARESIDPSVLEQARTLLGFGEKITIGILANIPVALLQTDMPRRKLANKIHAQFGCDTRLRQSGKWTGKTKLSKRGCRYARTALYQAAICVILNDEKLMAIYRALLARGKPHKVAILDIGRRLIRRIVALIKSIPQQASLP